MVLFLVKFYDASRHSELDSDIAQRFNRMGRYYLQLKAGQAWWSRSSETLHQLHPGLAAYID